MTIHEISKIIHMKTELIRSYRLKGLISPKQNLHNRYYDYSYQDVLELLHIKRLRKSTISLNAIRRTYYSNDHTELLQTYQKEISRLDSEMDNLKKQKDNLNLIIDHLTEFQRNRAGVSITESSDEKIDCYEFDEEDPAFRKWMDHSELFTQTVHIPMEVLSGEKLPDEVAIRVGVGSYRRILVENQLLCPKEVVVCPPGTYLTHSITLKSIEKISAKQLEPLRLFAKEHHYRFDSDTTAFLVRIDKSTEETSYIFRLRVKVVPEEILY